jgi:hypothetical protein
MREPDMRERIVVSPRSRSTPRCPKLQSSLVPRKSMSAASRGASVAFALFTLGALALAASEVGEPPADASLELREQAVAHASARTATLAVRRAGP